MTKELLEKGNNLREEIDNLEGLCVWCGSYKAMPHKKKGVSEYPLLVGKREQLYLKQMGIGGVTSSEYKIPKELQERIMKVVLEYQQELQHEMEQLN